MKKRLSLILAILMLVPALMGAGMGPGADNDAFDSDALASVFAAPGDAEFDGYIVKVKDGRTRLLSKSESLDPVEGAHGLYVTEDIDEITSLTDAGCLEYVEPNYKVSLHGADDPSYSSQWYLEAIKAETAWDAELTGEGIKVAVIDSGIAGNHEDFAGVSIAQGYNTIDKGSNVTDTNGHGTFVSGIIAAARNNGKGIAGMTDKVTLVPIKCFDGNDTYLEYIISGVYVAVDQYGCDIINMSLGAERDSASMKKAVDYACDKGALVISSVGNDGTPKVYYPAAYDNVVGVGSVGMTGRVSSFSQFNDSVFVVAPGEQIYGLTPAGSYTYGRGTSYSTPIVSSMAVMAKMADPDINTEEFMSLLQNTSTDLGDTGYDIYYGYGMVNVKEFIDALGYVSPSKRPPAITEAGKSVELKATYSEGMSPLACSLSELFINNATSFRIVSTSAEGEISFNGSNLLFKPDYKDQDKNIRIILSAENSNGICADNTVINITVNSTDMTTESADKFVDMTGHWAKKYVSFGVDQGLYTGTSEDRFSPDIFMDRAMFITALARMSGEDVSGYTCELLDVEPGSYYYENVSWAVSKGIVLDEKYFRPTENLTRADMAEFFYRFYASGEDEDSYSEAILYGFTDVNEIPANAKESMTWAASHGLISGRSATTIAPMGISTRGEVSTMILRYYRTFM